MKVNSKIKFKVTHIQHSQQKFILAETKSLPELRISGVGRIISWAPRVCVCVCVIDTPIR